jgi:hypothetical protein
VISIGCLALGLLTPVGHGADRVLLEVADFFLLYPALLLFTGVVPMRDARQLAQIAGGVIATTIAPLRPKARTARLQATLARLSPTDTALLSALVRDRTPPVIVARHDHVPVSAIEAQAARALRMLSGVDSPERDDAAIGHWLFNDKGSAERDVIMYFLTGHGVSMLTLHAVEAQLAALRSAPRSAWPAVPPPTSIVSGALELEPSIGLG